MLPMMVGMLLTSIVSGQLISRTGRYKIFPIVGCGVFTSGLFCSRRDGRARPELLQSSSACSSSVSASAW